MSAHRRALVMLALCGILWSTGGVLITFVDWHPGAIWATRSAFAAVMLYAVRRPSFRGIQRAEWLAALPLAATTGLFIVANKLTTPANAILIQYSAPVWVALLGQWFLGERATRLDWVTIFLVLGGISLFFLDQLTVDYVAGNFVALAAGVAFAFNGLTMRRVATLTTLDAVPLDPLRPLLLGNILAVFVGLPFVLTSPLPDNGGTALAALVALGVIQQGAAYLCYAAAVRHATAMEVMLIPVIEPILSPLWVAVFAAQWPGPAALVGGAIVVGAVTMRAVLARCSASR
jgi:drug/metabolite transporter (DMT)-like permease